MSSHVKEDMLLCKDCGNEKFFEEGVYRCEQCEWGHPLRPEQQAPDADHPQPRLEHDLDQDVSSEEKEKERERESERRQRDMLSECMSE